jgi:hypothetical protein
LYRKASVVKCFYMLLLHNNTTITEQVPSVNITAANLLESPTCGSITIAGLSENIDVCLEVTIILFQPKVNVQ